MGELMELRWMLPPLAICLVLTGIHGYLGIHVLSRKVIFVDLALAQIAALGTTYAFLLGYDPAHAADATPVYLFSLTFTILGAAVFALTRMRHERVPQEAFIGITYATASAVAILLLSKSAAETEHIKSMLVGNVLLITWPTILKTALIYAAIGVFHYVFRGPFFRISLDPEGAMAGGLRVRLWDFLFYASFGVVITSSVAIAGVLLVFTYLVVPAAIGVMFAQTVGGRIGLAWGVGTFCSLLGILLSYYGDLPTGPAVVSAFAVFLLSAGVLYYLQRAVSGWGATARVAAGVLAVGLLGWGSLALEKSHPPPMHIAEFDRYVQALADSEESVQVEAIHHLEEIGDRRAIAPLLDVLRRTASDRIIEHTATALARFGDGQVAAGLVEIAQRPDLDPYLKLTLAQALFGVHSPQGFAVLLAIVPDEQAPTLARDEALDLMSRYSGHDFRVQSGHHASYATALQHGRDWWDSHHDRLQWREDAGRFE